MKEFPKEWCTYVCQEVIEWLNKKHPNNYIGDYQFYGEIGTRSSCQNKCFGTYLSHEDFMEAIGEHTMKVGDMVWISFDSEEDARKYKKKRELLAILPEDIIKVGRYICRNSIVNGDITNWKYAVPIVKEERKERKLMLTDQEWEKLEKAYK